MRGWGGGREGAGTTSTSPKFDLFLSVTLRILHWNSKTTIFQQQSCRQIFALSRAVLKEFVIFFFYENVGTHQSCCVYRATNNVLDK